LAKETPLAVDNPVENIYRIFPQVEMIPKRKDNGTYGLAREASSHIWDKETFIHTIHTPYYYYDSHT
jgi:hypothetical protein